MTCPVCREGPLLGTLETPVADLQPATKETPND